MTPQEFQFASRSLDDFLRNPQSASIDAESAERFEEALREVPPDPPHDPLREDYRLEPRSCACRVSDAWRCARDKNLTGQIACRCRCHRYMD